MDEMARINKGFMKKDGKTFLPITHESLVMDNDGLSINKKYITKNGLVGYATEDYVNDAILKAQFEGANVDLSKYATVDQLELKANIAHDHDDIYIKVEEGKSLIADSEIERLSTLFNYDDTDIRNALITKANTNHNHDEIYASKITEHSHVNKSVLDTITIFKINEWDSKSEFSGSYNDLTDKPEIPTDYVTEVEVDSKIQQAILGDGVDLSDYALKEEIPTTVSQLVNDSNFITLNDVPVEIPRLEGSYTQLSAIFTELSISENVYILDGMDIAGDPVHINKKDDNTIVITTMDGTVMTRVKSGSYWPLQSVTQNATEVYVDTKIAEAQLSKGEIDLTSYATINYVDGELANKVDKVDGKSLVDDLEIARLATLHNYDDTGLSGRVSALESIDHSAFVTNTELESKGYLTEHQDLSNYATKDELHAQPNFTYAINVIEPNEEPSVVTTGTYPDLVITFNIPKCSYNGEIVDPVIDYMYYGRLSIEEVGGKVIQYDAITADMIKTGAAMTKAEAGVLGKTSLGLESDTSTGDYFVIAVPSSKNLKVTQDNGFGDKTIFNTEVAGTNGETKLNIDGVQYDIYGEILLSPAETFIYIDE